MFRAFHMWNKHERLHRLRDKAAHQYPHEIDGNRWKADQSVASSNNVLWQEEIDIGITKNVSCEKAVCNTDFFKSINRIELQWNGYQSDEV